LGSLVVLTPPAEFPVSLSEVKAWARVTHDDENDIFTSCIKTATDLVEGATNRALMNQTLVQSLDYIDDLPWPVGKEELFLDRPPLSSVTSVTYVSNDDGTTVTIAPSLYRVQATVGSLAKGSLFREDDAASVPVKRGPGVVKVTYVAGYGATAADVPEALRNAVRTVAVNIYDNMGAVTDPSMVSRVIGAMAPRFRLLAVA